VTLQLFATNELAWPVTQKQKNLKRLALKPYEVSAFTEIARDVVIFERTEDELGRTVRLVFHWIETVSQHADGQ
jgi:hypothetical protein